ncbi:hypothetical protein E9531_06145 [Lampropedia puyangensis]|uniref:General secretion pathway protein GspL n=1 Tax=Lampropedia puyangensis TaxID=1330072 RepID=A0A4S8F934_9BURK|nr:type II secretion system protein GspL [Lampropedia puyangensis]THU03757.1 hypothetical protein E9531_06145 [Lampropedia puyangensis]
MPFLFIEAPSRLADTNSPLVFAQSVDGHTVSHSGTAAAALIPKPDKGTVVSLVLPVQAVSWHRVTLPSISLKDRPKVRAVLQGLLEDQLLEDPAELHLALAPDAAAGQACWVAACKQDYLQHWLQTLAGQGIAVQRIVPAFAPDTTSSTTLYALGTEESPWLVVAGANAPDTETGTSMLALPLTAAAASLEVVAASPSNTPILAEPAVYQIVQHRLGRAAQLLPVGQRLLLAGQSAWNMAQFQFANSGRDKLAQGVSTGLQALLKAPQWRWLRWGLAGLIGFNIIGLNAWAWQAQRDLANQRAQIQDIFTTTFPKVPVVVDAPLQMRQQLQRLQKESGSPTPASFEVLAAQIGTQLPSSLAPTEIRYDNGRLSLLGLPQDQAATQQWQSTLQEQGILSQWVDGALQLEPATPHLVP